MVQGLTAAQVVNLNALPALPSPFQLTDIVALYRAGLAAPAYQGTLQNLLETMGTATSGAPAVGTDLVTIIRGGVIYTVTISQLLALDPSVITYVIDGGGQPLTTGTKGALLIDFNCSISKVTLLADQSGSAVVDIWKLSEVGYNPPTAPTSGNSICAAALPTLSAANKYQDSTLTGWTKAISAGDTLSYHINSAATLTRLTVALTVTKT